MASYNPPKLMQIMPVPFEVWAIFDEGEGEGEGEVAERIHVMALTCDGDVIFVDFDEHGLWDDVGQYQNLKRFQYGPLAEACKKPIF